MICEPSFQRFLVPLPSPEQSKRTVESHGKILPILSSLLNTKTLLEDIPESFKMLAKGRIICKKYNYL